MIKIDKPTDGPDDQTFENGKAQWRVAELIFLSRDLEVMEIPLEHMNFADDTICGCSVRNFVANMIVVNDCDLSYPIILSEDGEIMDGRHRLVKALLEGKKTIRAVRFKENPVPTRYLENDDD